MRGWPEKKKDSLAINLFFLLLVAPFVGQKGLCELALLSLFSSLAEGDAMRRRRRRRRRGEMGPPDKLTESSGGEDFWRKRHRLDSPL